LVQMSEQNTDEHAITVKPVGVTTQVLVEDWVALVTDVLPASKFLGNGAGVRAYRERKLLLDGREVS
ncbi:MAG: hypothetical protein Q9194_006400, partial [Teloschistes cf. exilis]